MNKDLKYRAICPLCGKAFDSREGKIAPDGKVVCGECYEHFGFGVCMDWGDEEETVERSEKKQYPEFVPKDWTECYKLPLELDKFGIFAYDVNNHKALSCFTYAGDENDNFLPGEKERVRRIIDIINGDKTSDFDPDWEIDPLHRCEILYKGVRQFLVRGWGYLTGCGGLNLPEKLAAKMQDGFINYIIDKLNGKHETI